MIHAESRSNAKPLTAEELKQKQETAEKINFHISHFFDARKKTDELSTETLLEMTLNLAQMSPEIYTIYNVRRELLNKTINSFPAADNKRYEIINKELDLVNFLLKKQPKSYSLFTHRQWLITQGLTEEKSSGIEIMKGLLPKELFFCAKMLEKDERNFHVWNYRNWLVELSNDVQFSVKEEAFTKMKVEQNFTNFSALHFRAVNFLRLYGFLLKNCQNIEEKKEIVAFGVPLKVISRELEFISTGLYMQTNEQGIWQYHRWLIELLLPIYVAKIGYLSGKSEEFDNFYIVLSRKCRNLNFSHFDVLVDGEKIEGKIENFEKIEISQFWKLTLPKQNKKTISIKVKNCFGILESDSTNQNLIQDINRKRFILESEFKFEWNEGKKCFEQSEIKMCSDEDLKFRNFAMNLVENSKKIVDEIATLEKNNKFVLLEKNYLLEVEFPNNSQESFINCQNTKNILENLRILVDSYKKQCKVFEHQIEIYEKKKEVEESILSGKIDESHLISLFESQGKQQEIKLLLAKAGLCIDYLTN